MIFTTRFRIALLLCCLLVACREEKRNSVSPDMVAADSLISPEKMILIMSDVHIVEAALLVERNEGRESDNKAEFYYKGIFDKYHISHGRYDQNLSYYRQNPENFAKMYEKVIEVIETRQKKIPRSK